MKEHFQLIKILAIIILSTALSNAQVKTAEMLVEIPTGTNEKWEFNKSLEELQIDSIDGKPRIIDYLGYPGNYGMLTNTLLSKDDGGDGDPLDVILPGHQRTRGELIRVKLIGVLKLLDNGEQDHKIIAVSEDTPFWDLQDIDELDVEYPGILEILKIWFTNYKGPGQVKFVGFGDKNEATMLYDKALVH